MTKLPPTDPVASTKEISGCEFRIMPMGDSNTAGANNRSYRTDFYDLMDASGATFDLVGRDTEPTVVAPPDDNHWGNSGYQIANTTTVLNGISYKSLNNENRSGLFDEMDSAISTTYFSTDPDVTNVILLMIGTNDILKG
ncbi:MAG: hypothetical protein HC892_15690 [Saprospiraceae bacterium]|nr:hypothetical protein [Saprospiraceae bacterium]